MAKHKTLGQVFTPNWIVQEILDAVGFVGEQVLHKKIIDPACGDGAFLKEIVRRILDQCANLNLNNEEIIGILEKNVYGIEIDFTEYKNCIINLNEVVYQKLNRTLKIKWNIVHENTLLIYKKYSRTFDFVVGNPPYIRIHNLDEDTRRLLKTEFYFSQGTIDIYISFFEIGFQLIKENGTLGYITPNSFLHNSSYIEFRKYLKKNKALKSLTDFKSNKVFEKFSTYTAISILNFSDERTEFTYQELRNGKIETLNHISYTEVHDKDWSFSDAYEMQFLHELKNTNTAKISDFFDIQYGFATLRDAIFIENAKFENQDEALFNGFEIEKDLLRPIVKGSTYKGTQSELLFTLFPYQKIENRYVVISENELKVKYPKTYSYFLHHKDELLTRDLDKGALWYEYGRSQGIQTMHQEKIVVSPLMKDRIIFHELDAKTLVYSGIFMVRKDKDISWQTIRDVLSSDDFVRYVKIIGKDMSGGYKSITSNLIKSFPIKNS